MLKDLRERMAIEKLYEAWVNDLLENIAEPAVFLAKYYETDRKKMFLAGGIFGIVTKDHEMDLELGDMLLKTLNHIHNQTNLQFTKDRNHYRDYVISCNYFLDWLVYGKHIRCAYFNTTEAMLEPVFYLEKVGYYPNRIQLTPSMMDWFIQFLNGHAKALNENESIEETLELANVPDDAKEYLKSLMRIEKLIPNIEDNEMMVDVQTMFLVRLVQGKTLKKEVKTENNEEVVSLIEKYVEAIDYKLSKKNEELKVQKKTAK